MVAPSVFERLASAKCVLCLRHDRCGSASVPAHLCVFVVWCEQGRPGSSPRWLSCHAPLLARLHHLSGTPFSAQECRASAEASQNASQTCKEAACSISGRRYAQHPLRSTSNCSTSSPYLFSVPWPLLCPGECPAHVPESEGAWQASHCLPHDLT